MRNAVLALLLCVLLAVPALAVDVQSQQAVALDTDELSSALPEEAQAILGDLSVTDALEPDSILRRIFADARDQLLTFLRAGARSAVIMLGIVIFCAIAETFASERTQQYVELGGALGIAAAAAGDLQSFIGLGTRTLHSLSDFSKALLPTLAAAAAAGGAVSSGAAKYAATAMFLDFLITAADTVVMPVIYGFIAVTVAKAALGNEAFFGAASLLKWLAGSLITLLMLAFTGYLSLTGVISGTADAAAARLAKTTISTVLPVVGSIVSDAASAVVSGAGILRNAIGVFGLLAVLCVCLTPFLRLGVQYLTYKAAAGLAGVMADKRLQSLIGGIGTAFGMVMGLVGAGVLMLFFSVISSVKAVTGA